MKHNRKLSSLSLAMLGLISQKPQSGYDLRKIFSTTPMGRFSNSPGAIYPALKRIEGCGWIGSSVDAQTELRPKRIYRITKDGLAVLKEHLLQQVTVEDVIWHMDDIMLRFAFMDNRASDEEILQFLEELLSSIEAYIESLRAFSRGVLEKMPRCGRLAMEQGIEGYQANARWAKRAIKELKQ